MPESDAYVAAIATPVRGELPRDAAEHAPPRSTVIAVAVAIVVFAIATRYVFHRWEMRRREAERRTERGTPDPGAEP